MKLNIEYVKPTPKPIPPSPADKYKDPVSVWQITTEGDCEGRSTTNLGVYRGHVAEIAFYLADKCYYTLQFKNLTGTRTASKKVPKNIKTSKKSVWISFDIESKTWDMSPEVRSLWVANMLDCSEQIDVYGSYGGVTYYASACLVLK